jgi:hypothetical protein
LRVGLGVSVFIGDDVGSSRQNRGGSADFVGEVSFGWGRVSGGQGEGERESIILGSNFCSLYGFNSL